MCGYEEGKITNPKCCRVYTYIPFSIPNFKQYWFYKSTFLMPARNRNVSANVLKTSIRTQLPFLKNMNNSCSEQNKFPDALILVNVISIFNKKDPLNEKNYRPVRLISLTSKAYKNHIEAINQSTISTFCGFRKINSSHHS